MSINTKRCSVCKEHVSLSEFHRDSTHSDGLTTRCKKCRKKCYKDQLYSERSRRHFYNKVLEPQGYRQCRVCNAILALNGYRNLSSDLYGKSKICIECVRTQENELYYKYRQKRLDLCKKVQVAYKKKIYFYLMNYCLQMGGCTDCGESRFCCLDFDHVDIENKKRGVNDISSLVRRRVCLSNIQLELKKCEIRCTNCHHIKTLGQTRSGEIQLSRRSSKNSARRKYLWKYEDRNSNFLSNFLKNKVCTKCSMSDIRVLSFHHIIPEKKANSISKMKTASIESLKLEISKCEILCRNCHRVVTADQFNWYNCLQ